MQRNESSAWRPAIWVALLVAASIAFTLGLACAMPFAGLGAAAAITLPRRDALALAAGAWLANQILGFALLGYPGTASTIAWGAVLGIVAALATLAAQQLVERLEGQGVVVLALASFVGAFVVYEGGLFLVAAAWLGGTEDFAPPIVFQILALNATAYIGLLVLHRIGMAIGLAQRPALSRVAT